MTEPYTPTVEQVRGFWASDGKYQPAAKSYDEVEGRAEFDRFLANVRAEAWEEGAQQGFDDCENGVEEWTNPYRKAD